MPFKKDSFDAVLCLEVLEHTDNPQWIVDESYYMLKPNGKALFTIPFLLEIHDNKRDYFRFTRLVIMKMFSKYSIVQINEQRGGALFSIFWQICCHCKNLQGGSATILDLYWISCLRIKIPR
jgi:ubiquinone/menaquinone biosynthesis C-methylase UbiE